MVQGLVGERNAGQDGPRYVGPTLLSTEHCSTTVCVQGERKVGDQVNLERAMGAHVRFGGHFVQVCRQMCIECSPVP